MPQRAAPTLAEHGSAALASVTVEAYNAELRDAEGFLGDRASRRAFAAILDDERERLERADEDPLGDDPTEEIRKDRLDLLLREGDPEAAALVVGAIEEFAGELARVARRFLRLKGWKGVERIAVGGGMRDSRVGEIAIGRASVLLKAEGLGVALRPIAHHPDEAGLIGAAHLAPAWIFSGHDCLLAADLGGTNFRAGLVELNLDEASDLSRARVVAREQWRHRDDAPTREEAVGRLADMLRALAERARKGKRRLAPFVGVGCPGIVEPDGRIARGGQNLPGDWESARFDLPARLREALPEIAGHETIVLMHNDAVVQGLSELPRMRDVERWGVFTIGTGLGNAAYANRRG